MHSDTITAIERLWSRSTIENQGRLIRRFVEHHGRNNVRQDVWLRFLAQEFDVPDPPVSSRLTEVVLNR